MKRREEGETMKQMKQKTRTHSKIIVAVSTALMITVVAFGPTQASAALPAPNYMPGFPMLAGEQVIVMWMMVPGAASYKVYIGDEVVFSGAAVQTMIPVPKTPGEHAFFVTAIGADGSESPKSRPGIIKIISLEPPANVTALVVGGEDIALRWTRAEGAFIYDIYRRKKDEKEYRLLESTQALVFRDKQLEKDVTYVYALKSKSNSGKLSDYSAPAEAVVKTQEAVAAKEIWKIHALPMIKRASYRVPGAPIDVVSFDDGRGAIVSDGNLHYFPNVAGGGTYATLFKSAAVEPGEGVVVFDSPVKGVQFSGLALDKDGTLLAASRKEVLRIDWERESVIWRTVIPPAGTDADGDPDGEPLKFLFTIKGKEIEKEFKNQIALVDVAVGLDGTIYATDNQNQRVVKLSPDGEFLGTMGYDPDEGVVEAPNWRISAANYISANADGLIFVNSPFNIRVFDKNEEFLYKIGGLGDTVGSFGMVQGTMHDADGRLWALDVRNGTLQVFSKGEVTEDGKVRWVPVAVGTNDKKQGNPEWSKPSSLAFGPVGKLGRTLLVTDGIEHNLHLFDVKWSDYEVE